MKRYTNIWMICILLCLVITAGCVEHLNHKPGFPVEDISTIHVTFVGCEIGADFLTISLHEDNTNIELKMMRYGHLKFHEVKDVPVQLVEDELELFLSRFEESFRAPRVPEPFPPVFRECLSISFKSTSKIIHDIAFINFAADRFASNRIKPMGHRSV